MKALFDIVYGPSLTAMKVGEGPLEFQVRPVGTEQELSLRGDVKLEGWDRPWADLILEVVEGYSVQGRYDFARRHDGSLGWIGDQADLPLALLGLDPLVKERLAFWHILTVGDLGAHSEWSICMKLSKRVLAVLAMNGELATQHARRFSRFRDRLLRELEIDYPFDDDPSRSLSEQELADRLLR